MIENWALSVVYRRVGSKRIRSAMIKVEEKTEKMFTD